MYLGFNAKADETRSAEPSQSNGRFGLFYRLPTIETIQSNTADAMSRKDNHNSTLPTVNTFGPPWLPNSIVELKSSTAMDTVNAMTAIMTALSPGPKDTIESAVAKQNTSKKTLPQVR